VLCNGLGRYEQALAAAQQASEAPPADLFANRALAELIEAATRSGAPERAARALQRLSETARASGTDWTLGIDVRSQALVSEGETAESLYREAIDRLGRTRVRMELGRAYLLYGEWLRRAHRRIDAREQLRTAHHMFGSMGADGFAERAARELDATGERVRKRTTDTPPSSPPARPRSPGWPETASQTPRSLPSYSEPPHRRIPPAQNLYQARHQLSQPAHNALAKGRNEGPPQTP
jgi:tetratricopeptide (TPR) repeat protein